MREQKMKNPYKDLALVYAEEVDRLAHWNSERNGVWLLKAKQQSDNASGK